MMTEEEARKRWCPFVRYATRDDGGDYPERAHVVTGNRFLHKPGPGLTNCIASGCMAWRWMPGYRLKRGEEVPAGAPMFREVENDTYTDRVGFCGLAGKP